MKKLVLIPALFFGAFAVKNANAQIGLHVNLHLGGLHAAAVIPVAAPVVDEPVCADDYYYYPEVEAYYSVPEHCYYYQDSYGSWISAAYLPGRYHDFDWRTARRVEIRGARPYVRHDMYRARYGGWSNRDDYYARAFPGRDRDMPNPRFDRNDRHDWNGPRDNGYDRGWNGDRDNSAYNNSGRNQGGYGRPDQNRGPQNDNGQGWNGSRNQNPNQGGYGQPDQNRGGNYGQGQQGGFGQGQNNRGGQGQQDGQNRGGQSQDQNQGGRDRGGFSGGQYTQHGMGVINGQRSSEMAMSSRPTRF